MSLQGKVAIVTGAGRGIGATIATSLAKKGANVVINYVSPSTEAKAKEVAKAIEATGVTALVVQGDVGKLEDIDKLVNATVQKFGKIDILVNNGGVLDNQPVGSITPEVYQKTFDINVRGVIFLSQAVVPHMKEGGRIVNLSSINARMAMQGTTVYATSKAAVEAITRVMGVELRDRNIRVTAVNPGPVTTDMFKNLPEEARNYITSNMPLADPQDIADVIVFLASPEGRWVNAVTVGTNNGVVVG